MYIKSWFHRIHPISNLDLSKSNAYMFINIVMIKSEKYYETFTKRVIGVVQKAKMMLDHDAVCIINWPFIYDRS